MRTVFNGRPAEINLYSDASVLHGSGAWGCVIVRPGAELFEASGAIRTGGSSTHCELKAAANAIHAGLKAGLIKAGDRVIIRCDNRGAVGRINGDIHRPQRKREASLMLMVEWISAKAAEIGFEVTAAWIKGHQPMHSPDPHAVHNRRADRLCAMITGTARVQRSKRRSAARPPPHVRRKLKELAALAIAGEIETERGEGQ